MSELAKGSILVVKDGILSIKEIQESIGLSDGDRLLLVTSESKIIRLFPVAAREVWFIRISLDIDNFQNVVRNIHTKLKELDLKIVYTSGVCMVRGHCFLEIYLEMDSSEQIIAYSNWLDRLNAVINVETKQLDARG